MCEEKEKKEGGNMVSLYDQAWLYGHTPASYVFIKVLLPLELLYDLHEVLVPVTLHTFSLAIYLEASGHGENT